MFSEAQFKQDVLKNPELLLNKKVNPGLGLSTSDELLEFCLGYEGWIDQETLFTQVHRIEFFIKALKVFLKENPEVHVHQIRRRLGETLLFKMELDAIVNPKFQNLFTEDSFRELLLATDDDGDTFLSVYKFIPAGFFTWLGEKDLFSLLEVKNFLGTRRLDPVLMDELFSVLGERNIVKFVLQPSNDPEDLPGTLILHHENFDYLRKFATVGVVPAGRVTRRSSQVAKEAIVDDCPARLAVRKLLL